MHRYQPGIQTRISAKNDTAIFCFRTKWFVRSMFIIVRPLRGLHNGICHMAGMEAAFSAGADSLTNGVREITDFSVQTELPPQGMP